MKRLLVGLLVGYVYSLAACGTGSTGPVEPEAVPGFVEGLSGAWTTHTPVCTVQDSLVLSFVGGRYAYHWTRYHADGESMVVSWVRTGAIVVLQGAGVSGAWWIHSIQTGGYSLGGDDHTEVRPMRPAFDLSEATLVQYSDFLELWGHRLWRAGTYSGCSQQ